MSKDTFNIHEWEKEKCDELVRAESRRVDYKEGFDDGFSNGQQKGIDLEKEEMLHKMIKQKIDLETISKVTGKTIEEIKKINQTIE